MGDRNDKVSCLDLQVHLFAGHSHVCCPALPLVVSGQLSLSTPKNLVNSLLLVFDGEFGLGRRPILVVRIIIIYVSTIISISVPSH